MRLLVRMKNFDYVSASLYMFEKAPVYELGNAE